MKRFLILILATALLCVSVPFQIFAEDTNDEVVIPPESEVYEMTSLPFYDKINVDGIASGYYDIPEMGKYCGSVYKLNVDAPMGIAINMYSITSSMTEMLDTECMLHVFKANPDSPSGYEHVQSCYEIYWYAPVVDFNDPGEYYLLFCNYADMFAECVIYAYDVSTETVFPDFRDEEVPLPGENDLWAWDAETKTLTLKDGLDAKVFYDTAISLPEKSTIVIEGRVVLDTWKDAIFSEGDINIIIKDNSNLSIYSKSEYGLYTDNGNITITGEGENSYLNFVSNHYAIAIAEEGSLDISGCKVSIYGKELAVAVNNGLVNFTDSQIDITGLEGIVCSYDEDFVTMSTEYGLQAISSTIKITTEGNAIKVFRGEISFVDCNTQLISSSGRGIIAQETASLFFSGGAVYIESGSEAIIVNYGSASFENIAYCFSVPDYDKFCYVSDGIIYDGDVRIYAGEDMIFLGAWSASFMKNGNVILIDEAGEEYSAFLVASYWEGSADENTVTGIDSTICYDRDSIISFTTYSEESSQAFNNEGDIKWSAISWEILDTNINGLIAENAGQIDTSALAGGTYTLRVQFQKQILYPIGWIYIDPPTDSDIHYVDVVFEVEMPVIDDTDTSDCCPGMFTVLSILILASFVGVYKIRHFN